MSCGPNTNGKKEKAFQRSTVPLPAIQDNSDISDEDVGFFQDHLGTSGFLENLDTTAIARSKKETERLFKLTKTPYARVEHVQESVGSSDDNEFSELDSSMEDLDLSDDLSDVDSNEDLDDSSSLVDSEEEQVYEKQPRKMGEATKGMEKKPKVVARLPIKLASGQIQHTGVREGSAETEEDIEDDVELPSVKPPKPTKRDFSGPRFGRASVADIIRIESRAERIKSAKEQIAGICQDILSEPENGLGLLRRLLAFAGETVSVESEEGSSKLKNDPLIRQLAIVSLTAVFKDIAPGYRIRKLTEKEKAEKVSQMVGQTRDWEQGLVSVYQSYLQLLEKEIRGKTDLAEVSLRCMNTLLRHLTHFNFRMNIMSTLVARLSRRSWDNTSEECLSTFIEVFRNDLTGSSSLEAVRLLNRMIKERHYNVHPKVLSCLLHLRLKTDLVGVRASKEHVDKATKHSESKAKQKRAKGKSKNVALPHLSKKAKKALKETKEIEAELHEAEAEVDREELATQQTETLKLLFVLYFSILKAAKPSPLLSAALQGLARFAHMVNIDFFRDLLAVLKDIMVRTSQLEDGSEDEPEGITVDSTENIHLEILCILTAFELLTGQGEALNLDLSHFSTHLFRVIPRMAMCLALDSTTNVNRQDHSSPKKSTADVFFRALAIILTPKFGKAPSYLLAAFSKRLLNLSIHLTDPEMVVRTLDFVKGLLGHDSKLDALLSTEERISNGIYGDTVDDPQLCNPFAAVWWEVMILEERHYDAKVRKSAFELRTWKPL
ncbi:hypothetical protein M408DRAFT_16105 [Serendipita vermifera MAFF 305830]|uniref:Nucleolar complex-associated protein 3 n=1 Tax=Serendipita vermifera MAFF 305830 TaxID=933852 RepID=A0A0C2XJ97_SERVB|nr:hypothetical protein M408DRAFT_16105 [Serendipita vermifera MAFF 305830]